MFLAKPRLVPQPLPSWGSPGCPRGLPVVSWAQPSLCCCFAVGLSLVLKPSCRDPSTSPPRGLGRPERDPDKRACATGEEHKEG